MIGLGSIYSILIFASAAGLFAGAAGTGAGIAGRIKLNIENRVSIYSNSNLKKRNVLFVFEKLRTKLRSAGFSEKYLNVICYALLLFCLVLPVYLSNMVTLWYSKTVMIAAGVFLPFYLTTLAADYFSLKSNSQIPKLIDEFRGAFIKCGKIRQSLDEAAEHVDRHLKIQIKTATGSAFIEEGLEKVKANLNNSWFNIFVLMLLSYKQNGGALVEQLYRLNLTMTRHNNFERKKNRKLIIYELFGLTSLVLSIPAVFWINNLLIADSGRTGDIGTNMIISRIVIYTAISLLIIRTMRKL